jgi:hypothetical protein
MTVINLLEYKTKKEEEVRIKVEAQAKLEEMKSAMGDDYNYKYFQLFDIFCRDRPFLIT